MKLQSISFVRQWADANLESANIEGIVAAFILSVLNATEINADRLAAIQRSFEPIDDDGTLRMEVNRNDVHALLGEILMLRASRVPVESDSKGEKECPAPPAQNAVANAAPSEPESTEKIESVTSDADTAPIVRQESKSRARR